MNNKKFIGRETELMVLKEKYSSNQSELIIIYGRRRIGKTTLIKESFNKESFYFVASRGNYLYELDKFTKELSEQTGIYLGEIKTFEELFKQIVQKLPKNYNIAIDEFPYLIEKDKDIVAEFQRIWDIILKDSQINLVLSGSSISIMEQEVLGYKSPLYGRRTAQIHLKEFKFNELKLIFPKLSNEELVKIYSVLGGVPLYLQLYEQNISFEKNIINLFCKKSSILYEEAEFLLKQELIDTQAYFKILEQINSGATKLNEIAQKSYIAPNNIHKYLRRLELLQIIKKKAPLTIENKKNELYVIKDKYYRFWLAFVYPNIKYIELEDYKFLTSELKLLSLPFSKTFEEICQDYIFYDKELNLEKVGSWWYKNEEIDILGISNKKKLLVLGECKFENSKTTFSVLSDLKEKNQFVNWNMKNRFVKYIIFSKSGFKDSLVKEAQKDSNVKLISIDNL